MRHLIVAMDLTKDDYSLLLDRCVLVKKRHRCGVRDNLYQGRTLATYFEKPSLRTKVSLETAINSLGGNAFVIESPGPGILWSRECVKDQARVVSRMVDLVAMRTFEHSVVEEFARHSRVPVINVLSDYAHPTQALADFLTIREHFGDERGKTVVFMGDGNNVARSLLSVCALADSRFVWCGPKGFEIDAETVAKVKGKFPKVEFVESYDPAAAVKNADIIYTDVWASMGQETEAESREKVFFPYRVDEALLTKAPARAKVMHCLPAHRGSEITDGVMDGDREVVYDQAENRMHFYRGLFDLLATDWR